MARLLLFAAFIFFGKDLSAQVFSPGQKTRIYLVRHAEKAKGDDPVLTAEGQKRAGDLERRLKSEKIKHIYVTQFRRTQMTGDSLRMLLNIDTIHYVADTICDNLFREIMEHGDAGRTILIIGHSNTLPKIIRKLGVTDFPQGNIPDAEYDNLYLVRYRYSKAILKKMKYGAGSGASGAMQ
jgi:2,3-bisphosphoglycerate-dependent phosphoglycerate mutase